MGNGFASGTRSGATPCPPTESVCGVISALSAISTVPLDIVSSIGLKVRVTGQTAPGAIATQFCDPVTVATVEVREPMVNGALPQFVMLTVTFDAVSALTWPKLTLQ